MPARVGYDSSEDAPGEAIPGKAVRSGVAPAESGRISATLIMS